jgi:hypothetical protein
MERRAQAAAQKAQASAARPARKTTAAKKPAARGAKGKTRRR